MKNNHDTLLGQFKAAIPELEIWGDWVRIGGTDKLPIESLVLYRPKQKEIYAILHVTEDNIKFRLTNQEGGGTNATWRIQHDHEDDLLAMHEIVIVSYGVSAKGGEIWPESNGNTRKLSYRRVAYTDDITQSTEFGYDEIPTILTEHNIQLLWQGKYLEDRSDYAEGRKVK